MSSHPTDPTPNPPKLPADAESEARDAQQAELNRDWRVRILRSPLVPWMEMLRPYTGFWMQVSAGLMVVTAAEGSVEWGQPFIYCAIIVMFTYTAALVNGALDAELDGNTSRLWRPIPAGRVSVRVALISALFPFGLGCAGAFVHNWQVGVMALAMLAAAILYHVLWRGSVLGVLVWAFIGVLLPAGAIQMAGDVFPSAHVLWIIPIGALTGAGAFMLYKLPDYERDDVDGARSILHWLGIDTAVAMTWAVLAAAMALSAASINLSGGSLAWLLGPLLYLILVGLFCIWMQMTRLSELRLRLQRYLILPILPLLLVCWLGAASGA